jgi:hypothetical protein
MTNEQLSMINDQLDEAHRVCDNRSMHAQTFRKVITMDEADLLERLMALFEEQHIVYCVIGGQGVNAYVEPLVSLDLDVVVVAEQLAEVEKLLAESFSVKRFPHSLNVASPDSDLRVQIQTDARYADFPVRASVHEVLGRPLRVAAVEDVLQGKVWAALDPERRGSKRQKDLADIARLIEAYPQLRERVPAEILERLV